MPSETNNGRWTMRCLAAALITIPLFPAVALADDGPASQPASGEGAASQPSSARSGEAASRPTSDIDTDNKGKDKDETADSKGGAPGDEAQRKAKQLFEQGETQYRLGNFRKALEEFQAALGLVRRPSILINIAQCYRQLKELEKARFYFKLFLSDWERHKPGTVSPYHAAVQKRIAELSEAIERQKQLQQRRSPLQWPKWAGVGLSGAMLVTATILEILAQTARNDVEEGKGKITVAEAVDRQEEAHQLRMSSNTVWAITGTVAAATAILFILDRSISRSRESRSSGRHALIRVLPGGPVGLSLRF